MKIGIMGGTFNPIHNGHLALAEAALLQQQLDEVWFMPSGLPAHKSNTQLLDAGKRLWLVQLALSGFPAFRASSFEVERPGFTYTADTVEALAQQYPDTEFYFIIGGDSFMKFQNWVKPDVISAQVCLLAAGRNGYSKEALAQQANYLNQQFGTKSVVLDFPELQISSQQIRMLCTQQNYEELKKMVPEKVLQYIVEQKLWKFPTN